MKKLVILILLIAGNYVLAAAQQYEPKILVLSPGKVSYAPELKAQIDTADAEIKKKVAQSLPPVDEKAAPNIKLMQQSVAVYLKDINMAKMSSFYAQNFLLYRFYEHMPNCLVLLKDTTLSGKPEDMQRIATAEKMTFVLNFSLISFYREAGQTFCKMSVQLYDQQSNTLLVDKEYKGDWNNHGFEFTCDQGSVGCTINNSLSQALPDVIRAVAANSSTLKREKDLTQERTAYIAAEVYPKPADGSLIRHVIPADSSNIELDKLFQCLYNADNTQFVGFFIKQVKKDPKGLLGQKNDNNVKIITSKDIHDKNYLDQSPQTYAYIVKGIKYEGKWYFEKSEVTYFDAENLNEGKLQYLNNLQSWDFFAENSTNPGPLFWEGKLFQKITDKRKDPNWDKYKDIWETEERENRDYIGMYEMVADQLKKDKQTEEDEFRRKIISQVFLPFYHDQVKSKTNHFISLEQKPEDMTLIYPKDKHVILSPIPTKNEKGTIINRYFVFLPATDELFEWDWTKPSMHKTEAKSSEIYDTISAFTTWNYSYLTLDDDAFWNEKVLAREGNNYKFLTKLK